LLWEDSEIYIFSLIQEFDSVLFIIFVCALEIFDSLFLVA